jgi:superfamily II DNA/RNA helicase
MIGRVLIIGDKMDREAVMIVPSRDELGTKYFEQLPYPPYPVQEEAMLAWFTSDHGVLVCAPTGTGKTMIAQAALFEALHTGKVAYYTTPLIALTEQKFQEMQTAAIRWGFSADDIGLITGNRKVNPDAPILIVVAEILLNRLLHPDGYSFENVAAVVMDEFHSFADQERGIVWELSLSMLPKHIRLMLLSATVGNAHEFVSWLSRSHGKDIELVEGTERKVPLTYHWVPDRFLGELAVEMAEGSEEVRKTPALIFCFNRDECWSVAEELKGLTLMNSGQRDALIKAVDLLDWTQGVGPKLKQMLRRGVGVHHAGMLPMYRRVVEELFEKKLLSVAVCTETLAAGINLPARSVVLKSLMKGPFGKEKLMDPSTAHQIFGRAGRPQFDTQGHVYVVADEDDVRLLRWKEKYDQIPEDTKDPGLMKKKKELKRKKPDRNSQKQYWTEAHFEKLKTAPPARLYSKGPLPWRLLAYLLKISPEVSRIRSVISKRLLDQPRIEAGEKQLDQMLVILHDAGFLELDPIPVRLEGGKLDINYRTEIANPTPKLEQMLAFRSVHPLYGSYLLDQLGIANSDERLQAFESVLELARNMIKFVKPYGVPPGPLETTRLQAELEQRGLVATRKPPKTEDSEEEDEDEDDEFEEPQPFFAEKLKLYFEAIRPEITDVFVQPTWAAGQLLQEFKGNFNLYIKARDLTKQEGLIFRHLLRLLLLIEEFIEITPKDTTPEEWQASLTDISLQLTECCRKVDPTSTAEAIQRAHAADLVEGETPKEHLTDQLIQKVIDFSQPDEPTDFGAGVVD